MSNDSTPKPALTEGPSQDPESYEPSQSLFYMFIETFFLLGRYFIIVYPVFLYFIVSSVIMPRTTPDVNHWAWWVIWGGLAGILFLFKAGWSVMMFKAVNEWESLKQRARQQDVTTDELQQIPFRLLKDFFPGLGEYGPSFLIGGIFWTLMAAIPIVTLLWIGYEYVGVPGFIETVMTRTDLTTKEIQDLTDAATAQERAQLLNWTWIFLGMSACLLVFNALTLFWQQYVVIKQCNPFRAFAYSTQMTLRHPFKTMMILFYFGFLMLMFSVLSTNGFFAFFGHFLVIITLVFFGLLQFLFVIRVDESQAKT